MNIGDKIIAEEDLEATVEGSHDAIRPGSSASFVVREGEVDRLIVLAEIERRSGRDRRAREMPPADALESFWRDARADSDRRSRWPPPARRLSDAEITAAIDRAVQDTHGVAVQEAVLVFSGSLPRSADGCIDRDACRRAYTGGRLA